MKKDGRCLPNDTSLSSLNSGTTTITWKAPATPVRSRFTHRIWYTSDMSTAEILERVLDPFTECLTPQAARRIIDFRPDDETKARIGELAAKADTGQLTDDERAEYHDYVEAFDLVAILKSKARSVLAKQSL
jgi:hypothetical protein